MPVTRRASAAAATASTSPQSAKPSADGSGKGKGKAAAVTAAEAKGPVAAAPAKAAGKRVRDEGEDASSAAADAANKTGTTAKALKGATGQGAKEKKGMKSAAGAHGNGTAANAVEDGGESDADDASDDEAVLAGFSDMSGSDAGVDSSDEEDDDEDDRAAAAAGSKAGTITASGVVKLPSSRDDAVVRSRLDKANKKRKERGEDAKPIVLYFGRLPKTMPEDALRAYLTQFGDIRRLRLARNKKSGATKHYAFVEFADEDVGNIVCETMHNYLLEGRLLQVRVVPKDKVHPSLWIGANRKYRPVPGDRRHRVLHDERPRSDEQRSAVERKLLARQKQRRDKIKAQGIDYDFEGYA